MHKLEAKDLTMLGTVVALSSHFLIGRERGEVIMDSETIHMIEGVFLTLSVLGESIAKSGVFTHEQMVEAGQSKAMFIKNGQNIEDAILDAIYENRDMIMAKIRRNDEEAGELSMQGIVDELLKEVEHEANHN